MSSPLLKNNPLAVEAVLPSGQTASVLFYRSEGIETVEGELVSISQIYIYMEKAICDIKPGDSITIDGKNYYVIDTHDDTSGLVKVYLSEDQPYDTQ